MNDILREIVRTTLRNICEWPLTFYNIPEGAIEPIVNAVVRDVGELKKYKTFNAYIDAIETSMHTQLAPYDSRNQK